MTEGYINKGKLIEEIRKAASRSMVGEIDEPYLDWKTVVSFIFDAPAEAVVSIRYGKWIQSEEWAEDYTCSLCGNTAFKDNHGNYNVCTGYCPHCGAKMEVDA